MNILIACEESQRVCTEFRKRGHRAFSCDIIEPSGGHPEWHIQADVLPLLNGDCKFTTLDGKEHKQDGKWDMLIAFPPCTYLSNAGAARLYPKAGQLNKERYAKGLEAKDFLCVFIMLIVVQSVSKIPYRHEFIIYRATLKRYSLMSTDTHTAKKLVYGYAVYLYLNRQKPLSLYVLGYQAAVKTAKATSAQTAV